MNILAIDTSCDETAVAISRNKQIVSNLFWSQISLHSSFGGVLPSLAQREHEERIDWVLAKNIKNSGLNYQDLDCIAVTTGPGLAIALGVGINKAKEIASKYNLPLLPINHVEAHMLSSFAESKGVKKEINISLPAYGLILSGGTTQFVLIEKIGKYKVIAETADDALGEALDKSARILGLGYPGGPILEKFAKKGNSFKYKLPTPLVNDVVKDRFSYSGLKTAFVRLYESIKDPTKEDVFDLAATFQNVAFEHIINVLDYQLNKNSLPIKDLLFGGGVANNIELRKKLRKLCLKHKLKLRLPYSKKLLSDNAGMIGVCAYLKIKEQGLNLKNYNDLSKVDREPRKKLNKRN